jgi:hypothetical protein
MSHKAGAEKSAPKKQPPVADGVTPLDTPCRLIDLRHWLQHVDALGPGADNDATITTTGNQITVG